MPTRELELVTFDMDGTLVDSTAAVAAAYATAVSGAGGTAPSQDEVVAAYPLGPPPKILAHFLGGPVDPVVVSGYHAAFGEALSELARVYDGIDDALTQLGAAGARLAVFTGADTHSANLLLETVGLAHHFACILGSDGLAVKPAPDGVLEVARRLDVDPARSAYVGDGPLDQRAARAAGALAVAAGWGHLHSSDEPADLRVASPAELVEQLTGSLAPAR
jgi:HAD superfamily hydrolase (TIGR01549 family)